MRYQGGKHRTAKQIISIVNATRQGVMAIDAFCGGLSITAALQGVRLANDANNALICLYRSWQQGWRPTERITEDRYHKLREQDDPSNPYTALAAIGCSFSGKWWGGFARDGTTRDYYGQAIRGLQRKMLRCQGVIFRAGDYRSLSPMSGGTVYCDPPYKGTTCYGGAPPFDSDAFVKQCAEWTRGGVIVYVSEYQQLSPTWQEVWATGMHRGGLAKAGATDRLFRVRT